MQHLDELKRVFFFYLCWIWKKTSVSSFYKENNFKPCLAKQLLNMFKLWCERGISIPSLFICLHYFLLLYYNQTQSRFAIIPRKRSEWAQCYSCDEKALSSRPPWSSLKIKVYKILSQPRDIWEIVLCFDVILPGILSFSVTTHITVAKQTRVVIHASKRKGGTLYKWSFELRRFSGM